MQQPIRRAPVRRPRTRTHRKWFLPGVATLLLLAGPPARAQESGDPHSEAPAAGPEARATPDAAPETHPKHTAEVHLLKDRLTVREPFNQAKDAIRIVAFLAPSCPKCLKNAGELYRDVLAAKPDAEIAVFIVWIYILKTDNEEAAREATKRIPDPRVHHYWDPDRKLQHQLLDAIAFDVNLRLYDVFLLYDRSAVWEKSVPRPGYWMHEYKGVYGPWWDVTTFASEVEKGLNGEPFANPLR